MYFFSKSFQLQILPDFKVSVSDFTTGLVCGDSFTSLLGWMGKKQTNQQQKHDQC